MLPFIYRAGPFVVAVHTALPDLRERLDWCYGAVREPADGTLVQFNVGIGPGPSWRRLLAPQAVFRYEQRNPFEPYPLDHAFPLLEWGTNWCIGDRGHQFLLLHAGVVERAGWALILPALPGSGKTTLTVALTQRGWRFLSDEFTLVDLVTGDIHPLPRAAPLKNASIDVIRRFAPTVELGPVYTKTRKGNVAHLRPPADALARQQETARPAWVLFPRYRAGHPLALTPLTPSLAFTRLAQNSFNYRLLGADGFRALTRLIAGCGCYAADYGDLDGIIAACDGLPAP